jgi:hypothetical protein
MIKFSDWVKIRESSPATRIKTQAALGLAPPVADIFSHGTPPPWQVKRLTKALKRSHKKKKRKKRHISEASASKLVNPNIDAFIKSVESLAKDLWELQLAKKKSESQEKIKKIMKKHGVKVADKEEKEEDKEKDKEGKEDNKEKTSKQDKPKKKIELNKVKKKAQVDKKDKRLS